MRVRTSEFSPVLTGHTVLCALGVVSAILALTAGCEKATRQDESEPVITVLEERVLVTGRRPPSANSPLSASQQELKQRLETEQAAQRPTHRVRLRDGRVIEGRIVRESPGSITVREGFGYSGHMTSPYRRSEIAAIETLPESPFEVTKADVELCEKFPVFHFVKMPPYSIVTDQSFNEVERTVRLLTELRRQFEQEFATLIQPNAVPAGIQVVFFGTEDRFRAYAQEAAPLLVDSAGFYSAGQDRLVLLNQLGSRQYQRFKDQIAERNRIATERGGPHQASGRTAHLQGRLTSEAKAVTERLIRHEGAHQLFHAYRIHSPYGVEPTWLCEGLAQYCETERIGASQPALVERLRKGTGPEPLLPLATVMNHRDPAGFLSLGDKQTELAYAQSWAFVHFLMHSEYRDAFLDCIRYYRDATSPRAVEAALKADPVQLLVSRLKTNHVTLETECRRHIAKL